MALPALVQVTCAGLACPCARTRPPCQSARRRYKGEWSHGGGLKAFLDQATHAEAAHFFVIRKSEMKRRSSASMSRSCAVNAAKGARDEPLHVCRHRGHKDGRLRSVISEGPAQVQFCPSIGTTSVCPDSMTPALSVGPTVAKRFALPPIRVVDELERDIVVFKYSSNVVDECEICVTTDRRKRNQLSENFDAVHV